MAPVFFVAVQPGPWPPQPEREAAAPTLNPFGITRFTFALKGRRQNLGAVFALGRNGPPSRSAAAAENEFFMMHQTRMQCRLPQLDAFRGCAWRRSTELQPINQIFAMIRPIATSNE